MSNKNGLRIAQAIAFAMIHVDGRKDLDRQKLAAEVWPELSRNRQAQKLSAAENAGVATKEEVHKICQVCQVDANFLYETPQKTGITQVFTGTFKELEQKFGGTVNDTK